MNLGALCLLTTKARRGTVKHPFAAWCRGGYPTGKKEKKN
jgi:hypothetical protein